MDIVNLSVEKILKEIGDKLKVTVIEGKDGLNRLVKVPDLYRLGLPLCGQYQYFPAERIQIYGLAEHSYVDTLPPEKKYEILHNIFMLFPQIPCVAVTRNMNITEELITVCREFSIPLLQSKLGTAQFMTEITVYLEEKLAPVSVIQGVLVNVYGLGILLTGESSIGKSECALELLKRGHMFIADDIIRAKVLPGGIVVGTGEELIQNHLEIRGIGIIDILSIFGIGSFLEKTRIELVIRLAEWSQVQSYDRIGLEDRFTELLQVEIPEIILPVRPGRNLAALVEIAALNHRLKQKGYFAAKVLNDKIIKLMENKKNIK